MRLTSYDGKTAIVTGASSGIGRALAIRLARLGARVALVARRAEELHAVAAEIHQSNGRAFAIPCDVADRSQVFAAAETALAELGAVDILVNNAGYGHHRRFLDWDIDDMEQMLRVNFLGTLYWTKAILPYMAQRRKGWVVMIASVAGKLGVPEESAYAASKFAQVGFAEALSYEVDDLGIHVLTVCPGTINTPFFDAEARARMPAVAKRMMIEPEPLIDAIVDGLAHARHEITVPRFIRTGYIVRALAPSLMRRSTKRTTAKR